MSKTLRIAIVVCLAGFAAWWFVLRTTPQADGAALATVIVPDLSGRAALGETAFEDNCAACHGGNAAGRDGLAPPLIHKIYEPNHHGDQVFYLAVQNGVRAHHWPFGNMPAVAGLETHQVETIVAYIRTLQRANGIE